MLKNNHLFVQEDDNKLIRNQTLFNVTSYLPILRKDKLEQTEFFSSNRVAAKVAESIRYLSKKVAIFNSKLSGKSWMGKMNKI